MGKSRLYTYQNEKTCPLFNVGENGFVFICCIGNDLYRKRGKKVNVVKRLEQAEYYVSLLFNMIDEQKCPFYSLIIKNKVMKRDVERLLALCEQMNEQYIMEKQEGLLLFDELLDKFEEALPESLEGKETAEALDHQGLFQPLMQEFLRMMAKK